ncbi:RNA-guided endonuclease InsQ/TnpB family protein [Herbidospora cretacea]|uniref:RNA-guided endonuclease InsQ/TnpB family protein n=1 Tax=Herbidospora cretacea TaxID=28444 RepID=UPI0004C402EC|nr:RNA-guided endonuclease TnpB family protein [Herbidospora cretacea]
MSRFRLQPTPAQETALLHHCRHARFVWNLAVELHSFWRPGRGPVPGFAEQCRQLTEARADFDWLRAGSVAVQQQALRDFAQAMTNYFRKAHGKPGWRKRGRHEGFRIVNVKSADIRRLSRNVGEIRIPKIGWVRFRWSRAVPDGVRSCRFIRDRAGRWFVALAVIPKPLTAPGNASIVGVDRGVVVSAALSTGQVHKVPVVKSSEHNRLLRLQRKLARAKPGSNRRRRVRSAIAKLYARQTDRRKDWVEKVSTDIARRFDLIAVEDLKITNMIRSARGTIEAPGKNVRQKAGLNRGILASGWAQLVSRLEQKAPGRVIRVDPRFTSQTCNACGHRAAENRENQADFHCRGCGRRGHADVNAAMNIRDIAARHVVNARGGDRVAGPMKREPQPVLHSA